MVQGRSGGQHALPLTYACAFMGLPRIRLLSQLLNFDLETVYSNRKLSLWLFTSDRCAILMFHLREPTWFWEESWGLENYWGHFQIPSQVRRDHNLPCITPASYPLLIFMEDSVLQETWRIQVKILNLGCL